MFFNLNLLSAFAGRLIGKIGQRSVLPDDVGRCVNWQDCQIQPHSTIPTQIVHSDRMEQWDAPRMQVWRPAAAGTLPRGSRKQAFWPRLPRPPDPATYWPLR